jgi:hypothetical protein
MASAKRIAPSEVRKIRDKGEDVPLICAYENEEKCEKYDIDGAFSFEEFKRRFSDAPKHKRLVFYCN